MVEDLTGKQFGYWIVLKRDLKPHNTRDVRWMCKCKCGNEKSVLGKYLRNGKSTSCGCAKIKNLDGMKFGNLTVIKTLPPTEDFKRSSYLCQCDCGNVITIKSATIYSQNSCGMCSHRHKDISGERFGKLVVKQMLYKYKNGETYCLCKCDCGNEPIIRLNGLKTGNSLSCGCTHSPSLIGKKFGRLTVLDEAESTTPQRYWKCKCGCGNYTVVTSYCLTSGHTESCGCLHSEQVSKFETFINTKLNELNVEHSFQHIFQDLKGAGGKSLRFDFYLPQYNVAIEYDGKQHFYPIDYFGGANAFERLQENDNIKNTYCKNHNIKLIRFSYEQSKEEIEKELLCIIQNPVTTTVQEVTTEHMLTIS